ncbi:tRNA (guanosine(37)-N1)-methyltransferase TrmD [Candidatus Poribacteria bacterium]|nr:tRNA (guanosine(37)-N1)-methyltransferase TrmD [Candidatus Poribacteria bacterium]MBT5535329.1 tRNA (guanosine(37)-N1)-methyltransferase TrmD [Candidatus Poribacteria bacterium]MBT7097175.1 tRNA (guanosine(37)-N1)-methyltransferase TrmD [Candidatus Poribacteria bacterium]MBT7804105.1 tRNA (guanosine(37)-N1)-methyltransferase TrmD [Candidatus Poribacteria bacterium]
MTCEIVTIFPEMVADALTYGMPRRAVESGRMRIRAVDLRDFADGPHRQVDDYPYGGTAGMVLKPEPLFRAVQAARDDEDASPHVVYMTPQGTPLSQRTCERLSLQPRLLVICGRYKGIDERARMELVDEELSVGDYVLSGGEIPALVLVDAVARLLPGVLSDAESALYDSFADDLLDAPHYTRPAEWAGRSAPEELLSGDPKRVDAWRRREALRRTWARRPELLKDAALSDEDMRVLDEIKTESDT